MCSKFRPPAGQADRHQCCNDQDCQKNRDHDNCEQQLDAIHDDAHHNHITQPCLDDLKTAFDGCADAQIFDCDNALCKEHDDADCNTNQDHGKYHQQHQPDGNDGAEYAHRLIGCCPCQ